MTERAAPEPWACKRCGWRSNAQGFKAGVPFPVCTRCNTLDDSNSPAPNARMDALVEKLRHGNLHDLAEIAPAAADRITALEAEVALLPVYQRDVEKAHATIRSLKEYIENWEPEFQQQRPRLEQAERDLAEADALLQRCERWIPTHTNSPMGMQIWDQPSFAEANAWRNDTRQYLARRKPEPPNANA